jgi:hypothetical protein
MSGFPIYSTVRHPISVCMLSSAILKPRNRPGKPPFDANKLEPLLPDRAGVKPSCRDLGLFIITFLPSIPKFFASRPSVVDPRVHRASIP